MIETATFLKIIWNTFVVLFSGVLAYLEISQEPFTLFAILLVIDYITGLWKAKTLEHSITSNKMKYGLISKLSLIIVPLVVAMGAKALGADSHYVLSSGMYILILSEVYSIIGNIYSTRTKQEFPEYDALAMIGKYIRNLLMSKNIPSCSTNTNEDKENV
jgi:toxin secretion/phage lysis holin